MCELFSLQFQLILKPTMYQFGGLSVWDHDHICSKQPYDFNTPSCVLSSGSRTQLYWPSEVFDLESGLQIPTIMLLSDFFGLECEWFDKFRNLTKHWRHPARAYANVNLVASGMRNLTYV